MKLISILHGSVETNDSGLEYCSRVAWGPGFPGGSVGKESAANAGGAGSIPGMGRYPRGRHGNLPQYFCLEKVPWSEKPGEPVNLKLLDILTFEKRNWKCEFVYKISKVRTFKNNAETSQNASVSQMWPVYCQFVEIFYVSR